MPECPICNKEFQLQEVLNQHLNDKMDKKHKEKREAAQKRRMELLKKEEDEDRKQTHYFYPVIPKGVWTKNYNPHREGKALNHFRNPSPLIADDAKTLKKNNKVLTLKKSKKPKRGTSK